jgi:hypothetical protein
MGTAGIVLRTSHSCNQDLQEEQVGAGGSDCRPLGLQINRHSFVIEDCRNGKSQESSVVTGANRFVGRRQSPGFDSRRPRIPQHGLVSES